MPGIELLLKQGLVTGQAGYVPRQWSVTCDRVADMVSQAQSSLPLDQNPKSYHHEVK